MPERSKKEAASEIVDPQLEFARLAGHRIGQQQDGERISGGPPPAVDREFCFSEEIRQ